MKGLMLVGNELWHSEDALECSLRCNDTKQVTEEGPVTTQMHSSASTAASPGVPFMKMNRQQLAGIITIVCVIVAAQVCDGQSPPVVMPAIPDRHDTRVVPVVNSDQLKGNWKQFKGELKKKWADITDDDLLYIEGHKDKLDGKIQERYGDKQEEVKKWVEEWFERHDAQGRQRPK